MQAERERQRPPIPPPAMRTVILLLPPLDLIEVALRHGRGDRGNWDDRDGKRVRIVRRQRIHGGRNLNAKFSRVP